MAEKYPQERYSVVVHVLQLEWIFLQRITNNTGDAFVKVNYNTEAPFTSVTSVFGLECVSVVSNSLLDTSMFSIDLSLL